MLSDCDDTGTWPVGVGLAAPENLPCIEKFLPAFIIQEIQMGLPNR
jgi:hypothetical protein